MAAKRKYTLLTPRERAAVIMELRLGRYYRQKSIAARYDLSPCALWRIEQSIRNKKDTPF